MNTRSVSPYLTIADQPTAEELSELSAQGYSAIVNLRHEGEPEQPLTVAREGELAREHGLAYHAHAVGGGPLSSDAVRETLEFLGSHEEGERRSLVHCRKGGRAAAIALLYLADRHAWPKEEVFQRGAELGLMVDGNLKLLVQEYLNRPHGG